MGSYYCNCSGPGYQLQRDGTTCDSKFRSSHDHHINVYFLTSAHADIDECAEDIDRCAQNCTDTDGSYVCSCGIGYRLASDSRGCNGR